MRALLPYAGIVAVVCLSCFARPVSAAGLASSIAGVRDYGAIGEGNSHPACKHLNLPDLAALRRYNGGIYGFATSCSNEMDWLAAEAAIAAGRDVFYPEGTFVNDRTITLPAADSVDNPAGSISLIGVSHNRSVLYWPHDLGSGHAAVSCASRYTARCSGRIDHLSLKGPGI